MTSGKTLNFVCVKWGDRYSFEYVNILYDMIGRNLPVGTQGKFICFTDNNYGLHESIITQPLIDGLAGWWNKMSLFRERGDDDDTMIYFDLDTVITGALDDIVKYEGPFAILRDFYRPNGLQSSVMIWRMELFYGIWDAYKLAGFPQDWPGGDQKWLENYFSSIEFKPDILQDLFPGRFSSYKADCQLMFPNGTSVVVFHGLPRPHEVEGGWVPHIWKVGGGSAAELEHICNTSDDQLISNIKSAVSSKLPWIEQREPHDNTAVIVAGGPSLKMSLEELRGISNNSAIFACNNVAQFLIDNSIMPDFHVMLDARQQCGEFIPRGHEVQCLYASQVHPDVIRNARLKWHHVTLWNPSIGGIQNYLTDDPKFDILVGGGSTVGLKAIALAFIMGYRKIHLFGFDSCYQDDKHHAYPQSLNDGEKVINVTVNGQEFKAAPWMVAQAHEFRDLAQELVVKNGVELNVHGGGLIPYIAHLMNPETEDEIHLVDGIWWPVNDYECRQSVTSNQSDLDEFYNHVKNFKVVMQAGGNVGVWPLRLAKKFKQVVTFEPDDLNFRCLRLNTQKTTNIDCYNLALGDKMGMKSLERMPGNCGAHFITEGSDIQIIPLDAINCDDLGAIILDIEGYELQALQGARGLIEKNHPAILIEDKGLSEKYGVQKGDAVAWLEDLGYKVVERIHRDVILTYQP